MSKQRLFSYKYRFYPTLEQEVFLNQTLGCARVVYNKALFEHKEERKVNPKAKWNGYEAVKKITVWKQIPELFYLKEVSVDVLQQSALDLNGAFKNFFEGRAKFPKFKKKGRDCGITLTKNAFRFKGGELFIAKVKGPLPVVYSRPIPEDSEITSATITKKSSGRWFVSFKFKGSWPPRLPYSVNSCGIDLGLESFLTTDKGFKVENPRFYRKFQHKLTKEQRRLSRKQKGSRNYLKQKRKVAKVHETIVNCRLDFLHKLSTTLIRENQTIFVEDLCVTNMVAQAGKGLRKSILDASWYEFTRQLEYKAEWYGRTVVKIDRYYPSSQICHVCNSRKSEKLTLKDRVWNCKNCGALLDRDVNAAKNIKAAGRAVLACGSKDHV
jgi:putative transposase